MKYGVVIETTEMEDFLCPILGGYYRLEPSDLDSKPFQVRDVYAESVVKALKQHGVKGYSILNGDLLLPQNTMKELVTEFLGGLHTVHVEFISNGILAIIAGEQNLSPFIHAHPAI